MVYLRHVAHFKHKNLVSGTSKFEDKSRCRNFETLEEHDELLIENINKTVSENDILYHCGDWSMGGRLSIYEFRKALKVKTIHLILGNHDQHIQRNVIINIGSGFVNAQNLFTSVNQYLDKKINGQNMFLCHYAMRTWHKAHKGSWNIHGHSHGSLPAYKNYKQLDVGIDTHPEFRPYHFDEIKEIMNNKEDLKIDHHV